VIGDKIVEVGSAGESSASRVIDADGLVVAPGFVDVHSHTDYTVHVNRSAQSTIRQGVTTELVGNCGITNAPVSDESQPDVAAQLRMLGYDGPITWRSFGEYLVDVEHGGISQNLAWLVGHGTIRLAAGIPGTEVSEAGLRKMEQYVGEAMEAGAFGLSTGLELRNGRLAGTSEVIRLAAVVGRYDGFYASHIRNRDSRLIEAVQEFLTIVETSRTRGQISHFNVRHDTGVPEGGWDQAVDLMIAARRRGIDVQADTTPLTEGDGDMTGVLPDWLVAGGMVEAAVLLGDRQVRERLRGDCDRYWRFIHKGQWERVRLVHSPQFPELDGRSFPEIAAMRGADEWDCYFDILEAAGGDMDSLMMVGRLFTEEQIAKQVSHPLFSLTADGYSSSAEPPLSLLTLSPISFCAHVAYISHHVRELGTLTLEEAVRKMTNLPASRFGIRARGLLATGYFADVVVFDYDQIGSSSSFNHPAVYPRGIPYVLVNGSIVVDAGEHTGVRSGRVLRRP
jgi:N-acyl-D-amino-acid deacylase